MLCDADREPSARGAPPRTARRPTHPHTLDSIYNLARLYQAEGNMAEAIPLFKEELSGCISSALREPFPSDWKRGSGPPPPEHAFRVFLWLVTLRLPEGGSHRAPAGLFRRHQRIQRAK